MYKTRVIWRLMKEIILGTIRGSSDWTQPHLLTGWWPCAPQSSGYSTNKAAIERNWRWRASPSLSLTDTWPESLGLIQGRGAGVYRSLAVNLHGSCSFGPEIPEWLSKPNSGGLELCLLMFTLDPASDPWQRRYHFGDCGAKNIFPSRLTQNKINSIGRILP